MEHAVKSWVDQYQALADGSKSFEIRKKEPNKNYQVGDTLLLLEYDISNKRYTGNKIRRTITHLTEGFGLKPGYVVLSLKNAP